MNATNDAFSALVEPHPKWGKRLDHPDSRVQRYCVHWRVPGATRGSASCWMREANARRLHAEKVEELCEVTKVVSAWFAE